MLLFIIRVILCCLHDYSIGSMMVSLWIPVTSTETVELKSYLFNGQKNDNGIQCLLLTEEEIEAQVFRRSM